MLRRDKHRLCYFMMCILLMAGMYTTYSKADSIAERAASMETARVYALGDTVTSVERIQKPDESMTQSEVCLVENVNSTIRGAVGRITNRSISSRREVHLTGLFLCVLCIAFYILKCWCTEEILCLQEKKYRVALIKYIHDIDGKKRMSCLT